MAIFRIRDLYQNEKIRFLAVGGFNTILGYLTFSIIQFKFGHNIGYVGSLISSHILVSFLAFYLYRKIVFKVQGNLLIDFARFQGIYSISLVLNVAVLPLLVQSFGINPYLGQFISIFLIAILSFLGHKFISFKRRQTDDY